MGFGNLCSVLSETLLLGCYSIASLRTLATRLITEFAHRHVIQIDYNWIQSYKGSVTVNLQVKIYHDKKCSSNENLRTVRKQ